MSLTDRFERVREDLAFGMCLMDYPAISRVSDTTVEGRDLSSRTEAAWKTQLDFSGKPKVLFIHMDLGPADVKVLDLPRERSMSYVLLVTKPELWILTDFMR